MPREEGRSFRSRVESIPKSLTVSRAIVASGQNQTVVTAKQRSHSKVEGWQGIAWQWYDVIGEFRYSCQWVGNILSKAILQIMEIGPDGKATPTKNPVALEALGALFGGVSAQAEMLRQLGIHFTVAGEAYIMGVEDGDGLDDWFVAAAAKTSVEAGSSTWRVGDETFQQPLAIRMWRPHPSNRNVSDAPSRAVLPILSTINSMTQRALAQSDSRLVNNGLLMFPKEISFGSGPVTDTDTDGNTTSYEQNADGFVKMLIDVASMSMSNRESAEAFVPIVVQVEAEMVDKVKWIDLASALDEQAKEQLESQISRLALGMDMPPEVLTGTADMNHWSSWQMEEAAIKAHTEPLLMVIVEALTEGYLVPYMIKNGDMDAVGAAAFVFSADTSKMRLRPNRSKEAQELNAIGVLSDEAMLRENGFDPKNDAMDAAGLKVWLTRKVASGQTTPELVAGALEVLGVVLPVVELDAPTRITEQIGPDGKIVQPSPTDPNPGGDDGQDVHEARPAPSLKDHPVTGPPDSKAIAAASTMLVYRALERAGNRMRTAMGPVKLANIRAVDTYLHTQIDEATCSAVLAGAWDAFDVLTPFLGVDGDSLKASLDVYTRELLMQRKPHSPELLESFLSLTSEPTA